MKNKINKLQVRQNSETHCKFRVIYFHNIFELKVFWDGENFPASRTTHEAKFVFNIFFIFREFLNFFACSIIFKIPALFICCQVDVVFLFSDRTITNEIWSRQSFLFNRRTRMWKGGKKVTPLNWWQLKL